MIFMCHIEKSTLNQLTKIGENINKSFISVTYYLNTRMTTWRTPTSWTKNVIIRRRQLSCHIQNCILSLHLNLSHHFQNIHQLCPDIYLSQTPYSSIRPYAILFFYFRSQRVTPFINHINCYIYIIHTNT